MKSDAPYESAVRTSLIPLHGRKSWGQNSFAPLFGIKFKKKIFFYYSMEAYIVHLAKGIRIFGQGYALKP